MRIVLALALCLAQDPSKREVEFADVEAAIAALKDDQVEVRNRASAYLKFLGERAIPALEHASTSSKDFATKAAITEITLSIRAAQRILWLRPKPLRLSLNVHNANPDEVLAIISKKFVITPSIAEPFGESQRVSFSLADASLWEAMDSFSHATGYRINEGFNFRALRLTPRRSEDIFWKAFTAGDYRLLVWHAGYGMDKQNNRQIVFAVEVLAPSGAWVEGYNVEDLKLTFDGGDLVRLSSESVSPTGPTCERQIGIPSRASGRRFKTLASNVRKSDSVTLSGTVEIEVPEVIDEKIVEWKATSREQLLWRGVATIGLTWDQDTRRFGTQVSVHANDSGVRFQIAAFDGGDVWVKDVGSFRSRPGFSFDCPDTGIFLETKPSKISVWSVSKPHLIRIPFKVDGVRVKP